MTEVLAPPVGEVLTNKTALTLIKGDVLTRVWSGTKVILNRVIHRAGGTYPDIQCEHLPPLPPDHFRFHSRPSLAAPTPEQAGDVAGMREDTLFDFLCKTFRANIYDHPHKSVSESDENTISLFAMAASEALTPNPSTNTGGGSGLLTGEALHEILDSFNERAGVDEIAAKINATFTKPDDQRVKELEAQIEWRSDAPPKSPEPIYGHTWSPYRWQAYKPPSEQFRRGIRGRWQAMNEHGGWDNAKAPDEWATAEQISVRRSLLDKRGEGA